MARLLGRHEVARRKARLESTFAAIERADLSPDLISHYARYLCVLVSGHAEQSLKELILQYSRLRSEARITKYTGTQLKRFQNVDVDKLRQLIESFDTAWWDDLEARHLDELDAFRSVAATRNQIAHGGDAGITLANVRQYFEQISVVLGELAKLFDPE